MSFKFRSSCEQVKVLEQMNYVRSEQAKTNEGAIVLVQMLCISDMFLFEVVKLNTVLETL
uniref:Uncharacterized protein n=1 Tax=Moorena producens (strain JHB) TaxID=1454205 RepID=A0A1D9G5N2_MOOP1